MTATQQLEALQQQRRDALTEAARHLALYHGGDWSRTGIRYRYSDDIESILAIVANTPGSHPAPVAEWFRDWSTEHVAGFNAAVAQIAATDQLIGQFYKDNP